MYLLSQIAVLFFGSVVATALAVWADHGPARAILILLVGAATLVLSAALVSAVEWIVGDDDITD